MKLLRMQIGSIWTTGTALACAVALLIGTASTSLAQNNDQSGLINVNLQDLAHAIPVSVAVPVGIAANVCDVSVLALKEGSTTTCTATNTSTALSQAIARALVA